MKFVSVLSDSSQRITEESTGLMSRASAKWIAKGLTVRSNDPFSGCYEGMNMSKVSRLLGVVPNLTLQPGLEPYYASAIYSLLGKDLNEKSEMVLCYIPPSDMVGLDWVTACLAKQLKIKVWNLYDENTRSHLSKLLN